VPQLAAPKQWTADFLASRLAAKRVALFIPLSGSAPTFVSHASEAVLRRCVIHSLMLAPDARCRSSPNFPAVRIGQTKVASVCVRRNN
jgi:hypothetical protein